MGNGLHTINVGMTGSGKTYHATKEGARADCPCLFFNPKGERRIPGGYYPVDGSEEMPFIKKLIHKKMKISFQAERFDHALAMKQLGRLVKEFMLYDRPSIFIIDEANKYAWEGLQVSPAILLAEEGRDYGISALYTTQYPARVSKTIFVNCTYHKIFMFNEYSSRYYKSLGYDVDEMQKMIHNKGKYSYILIENGVMKGVFKDE